MATTSEERYWRNRTVRDAQAAVDKGAAHLHNGMRGEYMRVYSDLRARLLALYAEITANGAENMTANELYKYNRYYELLNETAAKLRTIYNYNVAALDSGLTAAYNSTTAIVNDGLGHIGFEVAPDMVAVNEAGAAKEFSKRVWCADGLTAMDRVAANMDKLQRTVQSGLVDCVVRGASKDELVRTLRARFDVSFNEADRLARTELQHIYGQATLDSYQAADVKQYKYLATEDGRTSDMCRTLDGRTFMLSQAVEGENYPLMHVNCRCTTVPIVDPF